MFNSVSARCVILLCVFDTWSVGGVIVRRVVHIPVPQSTYFTRVVLSEDSFYDSCSTFLHPAARVLRGLVYQRGTFYAVLKQKNSASTYSYFRGVMLRHVFVSLPCRSVAFRRVFESSPFINVILQRVVDTSFPKSTYFMRVLFRNHRFA